MGARALKRLVEGITESWGKSSMVTQPKTKSRPNKDQKYERIAY